jgi:hypothetical protein
MARSMPAQVQVISERPGKVLVRAKPLSGRENDARPVCGFDGAKRRYAGELFRINTPQEFSPRWMDFVDGAGNVVDPPEDWRAAIETRKAQLAEIVAQSRQPQLEALLTQKLADVSAQFSMAQMQAQQSTKGLAALQAENAQLKADLEAATKPGKR